MKMEYAILGLILLVIVVFIGVANYRVAKERGKKLYCDVNCKDEESCDFLESDEK